MVLYVIGNKARHYGAKSIGRTKLWNSKKQFHLMPMLLFRRLLLLYSNDWLVQGVWLIFLYFWHHFSKPMTLFVVYHIPKRQHDQYLRILRASVAGYLHLKTSIHRMLGNTLYFTLLLLFTICDIVDRMSSCIDAELCEVHTLRSRSFKYIYCTSTRSYTLSM